MVGGQGDERFAGEDSRVLHGADEIELTCIRQKAGAISDKLFKEAEFCYNGCCGAETGCRIQCRPIRNGKLF